MTRELENVVEERIRRLDRSIRWEVLLHFSNFQWLETIQSVYGQDISADSYDFREGREKIFDATKAYKFNVLRNMEVSNKSLSLCLPSYPPTLLPSYPSTLLPSCPPAPTLFYV